MSDNLVALIETSAVADASVVQVMHEGTPLAIYNLAGTFYVTDDTCSHGNASLADGYVDGDEVECPFHQGRFSIRTGEPTALPCALPIRTYPVTVRDGKVCIPA